jgi:hypothetical protein
MSQGYYTFPNTVQGRESFLSWTQKVAQVTIELSKVKWIEGDTKNEKDVF